MKKKKEKRKLKKKKIAKKTAKRKPKKLSKKERLIQEKTGNLLSKGKMRGFVTYLEILNEFPNIEKDVFFLDDLYARLQEAGIDVLESRELLTTEPDKIEKKLIEGLDQSALDSVQMYLKEIGKTPLINAAKEKDLAKRIEKGDEDAKNKLIKANLRLVVSIAKNTWAEALT